MQLITIIIYIKFIYMLYMDVTPSCDLSVF